jgi:hypothetical protein
MNAISTITATLKDRDVIGRAFSVAGLEAMIEEALA